MKIGAIKTATWDEIAAIMKRNAEIREAAAQEARRILKNPEVDTYFPKAKNIDKRIKSEIAKMGCYRPQRETAIVSQNKSTTTLRDYAGILKIKTSRFLSKFKAVQNLFKKSILLDELDGNVCQADVSYGYKKVLKDGKLFTGKVIFAPDGQVKEVTKVKNGVPVSGVYFSAGILPRTYYVYKKAPSYSCGTMEPQAVKRFGVDKLYTEKFPQIGFV